jgi:hypothetical protein
MIRLYAELAPDAGSLPNERRGHWDLSNMDEPLRPIVVTAPDVEELLLYGTKTKNPRQVLSPGAGHSTLPPPGCYLTWATLRDGHNVAGAPSFVKVLHGQYSMGVKRGSHFSPPPTLAAARPLHGL